MMIKFNPPSTPCYLPNSEMNSIPKPKANSSTFFLSSLLYSMINRVKLFLRNLSILSRRKTTQKDKKYTMRETMILISTMLKKAKLNSMCRGPIWENNFKPITILDNGNSSTRRLGLIQPNV